MKTISQEEGAHVALLETLIALLDASRDSQLFRHLYVDHDDTHAADVLLDGDIACVFYVSSILTLTGMTNGGVHTTMTALLADLEASGWQEISEPRRGCIIRWGEKRSDSDGHIHRHIGFYLGGETAISMDPRAKSPQYHHYASRPVDEGRNTIDGLYWRDFDIYRSLPVARNGLETFRGAYSTPPPEHLIPKLK